MVVQQHPTLEVMDFAGRVCLNRTLFDVPMSDPNVEDLPGAIRQRTLLA